MHDAKALGVFREQPNGYTQWFVDSNGDHAYESTDQVYSFGENGDIPIMGDWTETGHLQIGIFRGGYWYVDFNNDKQWDTGDQIYSFGLPGDIPVVGDWTHTGKLRIGVYRVINGYGWWYVDLLGCQDDGGQGCNYNASEYQVYQFGLAGDIPLVGDWNHTGVLRIGVYRPSTGAFYLDMSGCNCTSDVGVYSYGAVGEHGIVGDWTGTGSGPLNFGIFEPGGYWIVDSNGDLVHDAGDQTFQFGQTGDVPVMGPWDLYPTVQLTISGPQLGTTYYAGDAYTVTLLGEPNQTVSLAENGGAAAAVGTTNASGVLTITGKWTPGSNGAVTEVWYVAGLAATPTLNFSLATPSVTLTNTGNSIVAPNFIASDTYSLAISAGASLANQPVTMIATLNGVAQAVVSEGTTNASGSFAMTGAQTTAGNWTEQWYVDGFPANPALTFYVATAPDGYSSATAFASIPNSFTAPVPPVPCDNISGDWYDTEASGAGVKWELQQQSATSISGTLSLKDADYVDGVLYCISSVVNYTSVTGQYSNGVFSLTASNPSMNPDDCGFAVPLTYTDSNVTLSPGTTGSCSSGSGSLESGSYPSSSFVLRPNLSPPSGAKPQQVSGPSTVTSMTPRYNVSYAAYIPVDHVAAVSTCQFLLANVPVDVAGKIYLGDANKGTYRASEALIVSVDAQSHGSLFYAPSETRNYGAGSPANGYSANLSSTVVTPGVYMVSGGTYAGADEDGVANDCHFWNAYGWADNSSMNGLGVAYPTSTQEQVNFYGSGSNPLEVPLAQIRWNMTVTIDDSTPSAPWAAVDYTLSCYPAHIVKVNGVTVYDSQSSTPKIPSSNGAGEISYCLTSTVGQQTGSGPKVAVPPN